MSITKLGASERACDWYQDGDEGSDTWATQCGQMFCLSNDTPYENDMRFCCYCGGKLIEHLIEPEPKEPDAAPEARTQAPALSDTAQAPALSDERRHGALGLGEW